MALALVAVAACSPSAGTEAGPDSATTPVAGAGSRTVGRAPVLRPLPRPDIVLVLMDDFSMDLLQTMRAGLEMQRRGASYRHAFVVDSLCCVSRASLLTGQYPHQTGVLANTANLPNPYGPIGGWAAFRAYGNEERSVNVRLQRAGYTTGFLGKFLNEYGVWSGQPVPPTPPGWTEWSAIMSTAYDGWNFESTWLDEAGVSHLRHHPAPPAWASDREKDAAYVGTVMQHLALDFIRRHRDDEQPYFLEVSTYGPHGRLGPLTEYAGDPRYPSAFRDRARPGQPTGNCGAVACQELTRADLVGLGDDQSDNAPVSGNGGRLEAWKTLEPTVTPPGGVATLRERARMVQSIDRMLARILAAVDRNTVVILTSDNGFHIGQHDLERGKGTPYDSDVRVPLLVTGPGIPPGERAAVVSNIDLAPTLEALAGIRSPRYRAGRSFLWSLRDPAADGADYAFFEHTWSPSLGGDDPDRYFAGGSIDVIPSYVAVRSRSALLVRFDLDPSWTGTRYGWEYYDYRDAPFERTNSYADPAKAPEVAALRTRLLAFVACQSATRDDPVPRRCGDLTE